jgi:hypothetical protein
VLNFTSHKRNANQNHTKISSHLQLEWPSSRAKITTNVGEDVVKQELLNTVGGNVVWRFLRKLKLELPYDSWTYIQSK